MNSMTVRFLPFLMIASRIIRWFPAPQRHCLTGLPQKGCEVLTSTQKVAAEKTAFYCYPDIAVVCGKFEVMPGSIDILTNSLAIFEVLSKSTQDYDRGEKFDRYRSIASLKAYVCISSLRVSSRYLNVKKKTYGLYGFIRKWKTRLISNAWALC